MRNVIAFVLASTLLVACGQRGPLSLPGEQREAVPLSTGGSATPLASPLPQGSAASPESAVTPVDESPRRNRSN